MTVWRSGSKKTSPITINDFQSPWQRFKHWLFEEHGVKRLHREQREADEEGRRQMREYQTYPGIQGDDLTWPDGEPIHGWRVFVKLSCGHHRVSEGWRGSAGTNYCCDRCHKLTTIMATVVTDKEPYSWKDPEEE